jgi:hypothetical protein
MCRKYLFEWFRSCSSINLCIYTSYISTSTQLYIHIRTYTIIYKYILHIHYITYTYYIYICIYILHIHIHIRLHIHIHLHLHVDIHDTYTYNIHHMCILYIYMTLDMLIFVCWCHHFSCLNSHFVVGDIKANVWYPSNKLIFCWAWNNPRFAVPKIL